MFCKFAIVLVALFAFQAASGSSFRSLQAQKRSVIEDVIQTITEVIKKAIKLAIAKFEAFVELIVDNVKPILDGVLEKLKEQVAATVAYIKQLVADAIQTGQDVQQCVGNSIEEIQALPEQVLADVKECINAKIAALKVLKDKAVEEIQAYYGRSKEIINTFVAEASDCGIDFLCLGSAGAHASSAAFNLAADVAASSLAALKDFAVIEKDIAACASDKVFGFIETVHGIVSTIETCIKEQQQPLRKLYRF